MSMINFSAQDKTKEFPKKKRVVLSQTNIVQVGVGALGCACAQGLVRSGAEHLKLIEFDTIESSNIPRQTLFTERDIGKFKVEIAKEKLHSINSQLIIFVNNEKLDENNVDALLGDADIVLDCTDNNSVRKIINNFCKKNSIPWIHAAAAGVFGEVSIHAKGDTSYEQIVNEKIEQGINSLGVLSLNSILTGTLQANLAVQFLTGNEENNNKLFRLNTVKGTVESFLLQK